MAQFCGVAAQWARDSNSGELWCGSTMYPLAYCFSTWLHTRSPRVTMQQPSRSEHLSVAPDAPLRRTASPVISEFGSTPSWAGVQDTAAPSDRPADDSLLQRGASCLTCRVTGSAVFAGVAVYLASEMRHVPAGAKGHKLMLGGMAAAAAAASIARALY